MRIKLRHPSIAKAANKQGPGLTFNNSLLTWQARWKAQRESQGTALRKATQQTGSGD